MQRIRCAAVTFGFVLLCGALASAQTRDRTPAGGPADQERPAGPAFRITGYMFGDVYWVASHHDPRLEGQNGFWFRRIYFTYDHTLGANLSTRFRVEMNSAGDFKSNTKLTPYIKDAYLRWTRGAHSVFLGISPTPTWEYIEAFWGYRSVEKTPLDLQRFDGSRDFGVALLGGFGPGGKLRYHVMVGNGSDTGAETDKSKAVRGSLGYRGATGFVVEGYAAWQDAPGRADRATLQLFVGRQRSDWRAAVHFAQQARRSAAGGATERLEILSGLAAVKLSERAWVLGRVDRMFDANPEGEKIPYLPFDPRAASLLVVAGLDVVPDRSVHLIPNVEVVRYGESGGVRPKTDVVPRLTFYWLW